MHSFGATISVLNGNVKHSLSSGDITSIQTSVCYFPGFNFIENENSSVSIGFPVATGLGITSNFSNDDAGLGFSYDLPAVLDYNIGCKSTMENDRSFRGYFGLGFGYYKLSISKSMYTNFDGATYSPMVRAGFLFGSSGELWNGHGVTTGMFYKKGLEKAKFNTSRNPTLFVPAAFVKFIQNNCTCLIPNKKADLLRSAETGTRDGS